MVQLHAYVRTLGTTGEATFGLVTASATTTSHLLMNVDAAVVLRRMVEALRSAHLDVRHVLHLRLYYNSCVDTMTTNDHDDQGMRLRLALQAAMGCVFDETCWPASTVIPVNGLRLCWLGSPASSTAETIPMTTDPSNDDPPFLALQAIGLDPVHLEQSIWIRHGRR